MVLETITDYAIQFLNQRRNKKVSLVYLSECLQENQITLHNTLCYSDGDKPRWIADVSIRGSQAFLRSHHGTYHYDLTDPNFTEHYDRDLKTIIGDIK
jgi:hypothetical protein